MAKTRALEAKVALLEKQLSDKAVNDIREFDRRVDLDSCLSLAETSYWSYIRLNGRAVRRDGAVTTYKARTEIWAQAGRDKANAIEECKTTWGR